MNNIQKTLNGLLIASAVYLFYTLFKKTGSISPYPFVLIVAPLLTIWHLRNQTSVWLYSLSMIANSILVLIIVACIVIFIIAAVRGQIQYLLALLIVFISATVVLNFRMINKISSEQSEKQKSKTVEVAT